MIKNDSPKVVVLILSYNGKHLLEESVPSYLANTYSNFTVTVIDNGSNDDTPAFLKKYYPEVNLIRIEKNQGYSGGFNIGLNNAFVTAEADYALVTNNDVKADNHVIEELVKVAQTNPMIGFVTGKVYYYENPDILQSVGKKEDPVRWNGGHIGNKERDEGQYDFISERFFADDIFTLVTRKLFFDTGGYDITFRFQCEEYDWQARGKALGYNIYYTPYAKIWHKESMTIGKNSSFKAYYDARNPMLVILKHKPPDFFKRYFWKHFIKDIFQGSLVVVIKEFRVTFAFKMWQGFISGIIWALKNKKLTWKHII